MKKHLIVGNGLAAWVLAFRFHEAGIPFQILGNPELSQSSRVAAGLWNPVVFKRMTKSWLAEELLPEMHSFYRSCEALTKTTFLNLRTGIKPFTEDQEKKLWQKKADEELKPFIEKELHDSTPKGLESFSIPNGYGKIKECGNLNLPVFLNAASEFFAEKRVQETFDHDRLKIRNGSYAYKGEEFEALVFCEGYLVKNNPFFSWVPLKPAKGELLHLEIKNAALKNSVFNRDGFLLDVGPQSFLLGSTYDWLDLNDKTTAAGLKQLETKLSKMIELPYTITKQVAGVRPSSIDRRPIIGRHPQYPGLFLFNGLGAKGVMLAPYFALKFVHFLFKNQPLPPEADLRRFYHLYVVKNA